MTGFVSPMTDTPKRRRRTDRERAEEELRRARGRLEEQRKRVDNAVSALRALQEPIAALEARVEHLAADPALREIPGQTTIDEAPRVGPDHEHLWRFDGSCEWSHCDARATLAASKQPRVTPAP